MRGLEGRVLCQRSTICRFSWTSSFPTLKDLLSLAAGAPAAPFFEKSDYLAEVVLTRNNLQRGFVRRAHQYNTGQSRSDRVAGERCESSAFDAQTGDQYEIGSDIRCQRGRCDGRGGAWV